MIIGVEEAPDGELFVHVECVRRATFCEACGIEARLKERPVIALIDLPCFGRRTRLVWHKRRFCCPDEQCARSSWTEEDHRIGAPRMAMTDRAGRWVTFQVGRSARTVSEVARELGCDWHTVNDTVVAYGEALVDDDPSRYGAVSALGLDEVLFVRLGRFRRQEFSTQFVDVTCGQLLDVVPGRSGKEPKAWLENKPKAWRDNIAYATLDLSGAYRAVLDEMLPDATQVADPFHLVKLANSKLDECRRRTQNETMGHRRRKSDPLYRCRRLLTMADEHLEENGRSKLLGLLRAGDPKGEVTTAWHAKEAVGGGEQSHQACQARRLWLHELSQLSDPLTALRRKAKLEIARDHHTPVKSEAPLPVRITQCHGLMMTPSCVVALNFVETARPPDSPNMDRETKRLAGRIAPYVR